MYLTKLILIACAFSVLIDKGEASIWTRIKNYFKWIQSLIRKPKITSQQVKLTGMVHQVKSEKEFDNLLQRAFDKKENTKADNQLVVLELFADWCIPCKELAAELQEMAKDKYKDVIFIKAEVTGALPGESVEALGKRYQATTFPTIKLIKNGNVVDGFVTSSRKLVEAAIEKQL